MRPLVMSGSLLLLFLSLCLDFNIHNSNELYSLLGKFTDHQWLGNIFWLQLLAAIYLLGLSLASCLAAYYEHKVAIRLVS